MMNRKEVWRVYPHNDNYEVSNMGRICRARDLGFGGNWKRGGLLKQTITDRGYTAVTLYKNKKRKSSRIHTLVLETFVGDCPKGKECNHKDGVKVNNRLENLEWVTPKENMLHASKNGLLRTIKGEKHRWAKLTKDSIVEIKKLRCNGWLYREIAEIFNVDKTTISHIIRKKSWRHII